MPKVFITSRGQLDFSAAEEYGTLIPVTSGRVNIAAVDELSSKVQDVLNAAGPDDILLINGHPILVVMAAGYIYRRYGYVNVLYHDPAAGKYRLRTRIDFKPMPKDWGEEPGEITCPNCGTKIADAPSGVRAVASEPCDTCIAFNEEDEK
jgi:hypothetical protein